MKKMLLFVIIFGAFLISAIGQVTDSTAVVTYNFGDSLLEFLKSNMWTLIFAALYLLSEWLGETNKVIEGSLWRRILNWVLEFLRKKATVSPKMKRVVQGGFIPRFLFIGIIFSVFTLSSSAQKAHPLRIYPFEKKTVETNLLGTSAGIDSTVFFGAAIGYDVFVKEMKTGDYSIGTMPGFGYGIKWNPEWNPVHTQSFLSFDIFVESKLDKDVLDELEVPTIAKYYDIKVLPMVGLLDWVHIGYGPLFKVGVNGSEGYTDWMFAISISKTL